MGHLKVVGVPDTNGSRVLFMDVATHYRPETCHNRRDLLAECIIVSPLHQEFIFS